VIERPHVRLAKELRALADIVTEREATGCLLVGTGSDILMFIELQVLPGSPGIALLRMLNKAQTGILDPDTGK
jgi:hypothetical protein